MPPTSICATVYCHTVNSIVAAIKDQIGLLWPCLTSFANFLLSISATLMIFSCRGNICQTNSQLGGVVESSAQNRDTLQCTWSGQVCTLVASCLMMEKQSMTFQRGKLKIMLLGHVMSPPSTQLPQSVMLTSTSIKHTTVITVVVVGGTKDNCCDARISSQTSTSHEWCEIILFHKTSLS